MLTEDEREKILARTRSAFAWVGNMIPDKEMLEGTLVDLRNVVFRLRTKQGITDDDRDLARALIEKIRERKKELENRLKKDALTRKAAMGILDEVSGLIKAINDLHDLESKDDLEKHKTALMQRIDDEKRWQKYLTEIKSGQKMR